MVRILLVDDEYAEREGVRFLLEKYRLDLEVHEEQNGEDALEYLKEVQDISVIITDIEMPFMNGLELCMQAKIFHPEIKTIIFSAYSEFEYARKAIDYSVSGYILKPINVEEFYGVMKKVLPETGEYIGTKIGMKEKKKIIREVVKIVDEEFRQDIGLEYISKKIYLTPSYLSTVFKKEMGISLIKYINERRLQEAQKLLLASNKRVKDISAEVGFDNLSYFCTIFKMKYGITPQEFRK